MSAYGQAASAQLAQMRTSDQAFYGNVIANADNAVMATLGKAGRALNNAGYDIADGAVGPVSYTHLTLPTSDLV